MAKRKIIFLILTIEYLKVILIMKRMIFFQKLDIPIKDIENCKSILLIDSNITYEQPILSHKIRKAFLKESKINSIHTYSYKNNFNLNNSLLINPNNFSETLIDIIEYLSVITVNDKTLKNSQYQKQ